MSPDPSRPHLGTLVLLTAMAVLSTNMFLPSLPAMTADFGTSETVMGIAISGYMALSAGMQLVMGPLSDRLGRRPVMLGALAVYVLGSIGCLLAQNITLFLLFRMVQGVVVTGSVISSAVIRDLWPADQAAGKLGLVSATMALAPMLGPVAGGIIDTGLGWRAVFGVYTALGFLALGLVWVDLAETRDPSSAGRRPGGYLALMAEPRFWAYALCQAFSVGAFYIFLAGAPFVAVQVFGLSTALVGLGLGTITAGFMLGSSITARYAPRLGIHRLMLAGRICALTGLGAGALAFALGAEGPLILFGATIFVGIGNGLTLPNANAGSLSVRPDLAGTAAGLSGALMIGGGALLTTLTVAALAQAATPLRLLAIMIASVLVSLVAAIRAARNTA